MKTILPDKTMNLMADLIEKDANQLLNHILMERSNK